MTAQSADRLDYRELFENHPTPAFIVCPSSLRILHANQAALQKYGFSREEFLAMSLSDLRPPEDVAKFLASFKAHAEKPERGPLAVPSVWRHRTKDGSILHVEISRMHVRFEGHDAEIGFVHDVTARQRLEADIRRLQKACVNEMLAPGLAHEINNPLSCVLTNLSALQDGLRRGVPVDKLRELAADAAEGAGRIAAIVRDLRALAEDGAPKTPLVDLRETLDSSLRVCRAEIQQRARLERAYEPVPLVRAVAPQLGQVFLNAIINALQAMRDERHGGHELRVATRTGELGDAVVEISDTGCGISPDVLPRVFDPGFTTKPCGEGSGLGLAVSRAIVESFGGTIALESVEGEGSTVCVRFPAGTPSRPG